MPAPLHAWIQDEELAKAIGQSNEIQRTYLREQLIPFIQKNSSTHFGKSAWGDSPVRFHWQSCGASIGLQN